MAIQVLDTEIVGLRGLEIQKIGLRGLGFRVFRVFRVFRAQGFGVPKPWPCT